MPSLNGEYLFLGASEFKRRLGESYGRGESG